VYPDRKFASLEPVLSQLQRLYLYRCRFDDLPSEFCGQTHKQNVIREVSAHFAHLSSGQSFDAEMKIFVLGNGGVGKTQLSRRLQDLVFDPKILTIALPSPGLDDRSLWQQDDQERFGAMVLSPFPKSKPARTERALYQKGVARAGVAND
jgi:hypothetical protein